MDLAPTDHDEPEPDEPGAVVITETPVPAPAPVPLAATIERLRPLVRPALALALIVVAYHYSIRSLLDSLTLNTPLAQLGLTPFIALALAALAKRRPGEPEIHDRQLDWIVGLPLVLGAVLANLLLPGRFSTLFWFWRIDLLTLPFYVAGVVALLFGVRTLWRIRASVLFLLLAWPYPYTELVDRYLERFTDLTVWGVTVLTHAFPVASASSGGDNSLFNIGDGPGAFTVQIASACSGANGLVGFMLVGVAFLLAVKGTRHAKISWLIAGAFLVWVANLLRIMAVMAAGQQWGESFAIDGLHPYIGLVVFCVVVVFMVSLLPKFGLHVDLNGTTTATPGAVLRRPTPSHRPPWKAAGVLLMLSTFVVYTLNSDLTSADAVATSLGSPRLTDFAASQEAPPGWQVGKVATYDWPKQFFGKSSTWDRYAYSLRSTDTELVSNQAIIADVVETSSRKSLAAYGIPQCYDFHGYDATSQQSVDLGNGVVGGLLTWKDPERTVATTTLYWNWPVKTDDGTRYERVTLLLDDSESASYHHPDLNGDVTESVKLGLSDALSGGDGDDLLTARLIEGRSFLVAFGQELVARRTVAPEE